MGGGKNLPEGLHQRVAVQVAQLTDAAFQLEELPPQSPAVGLQAVLLLALAAQQDPPSLSGGQIGWLISCVI